MQPVPAAPTAAGDGGLSTHVSHTTRLHAKRPILVQLRVIHGPFEGECRLQSGGGAWSTCNTSQRAVSSSHLVLSGGVHSSLAVDWQRGDGGDGGDGTSLPETLNESSVTDLRSRKAEKCRHCRHRRHLRCLSPVFLSFCHSVTTVLFIYTAGVRAPVPSLSSF